jgi:lysylphosphatidylglycerol synthetase-like protein (DUF2156 family)
LIFEDLWNRLSRKPEGNQRRRRWWKLPMVWVDPFRGYVAALYLKSAVTADPGSPGFVRIVAIVLCGFLVMTVVWAQTLGRLDERETICPAGFMAGLLFAMLPVTVAASVVVMAVSSTVAVRSYNAGFIVATITTAGLGFLFMGKSVSLAMTTVIVALPMVLCWQRGNRMVMPMRC